MDGQQFDRIARALGSGKSRRSVLKGMAAGLFGSVVGGRTIAHAGAPDICGYQGDYCSDDGVAYPLCCDGHYCHHSTEDESFCVAYETQCNVEEGSCRETPCCEGFYCDNESWTCFSEEPYCAPEGDYCGIIYPTQEGGVQYECCEGLVCNDEYFCVPYEGPICIEEGHYCGEVVPAADGGDDLGCCEGLVCNEESVCVPPDEPICIEAGGECGNVNVSADGDDTGGCCAGLICGDNYVCVESSDPPAPNPEPKPPVTKLPDTGAGENGQGGEWLIPTALGAAAAAVVGGKLLKGERSTTEG